MALAEGRGTGPSVMPSHGIRRIGYCPTEVNRICKK